MTDHDASTPFDDVLLARLRSTDPVHGAVVHPSDGPEAARLLEQIMNTSPNTSPNFEPSATVAPAASGRRPRWLPYAVGAGLAAAALAVTLTVAGGNDDQPAAAPVHFSVSPFDPMSMCLAVTEYVPESGLGGFRGTVVSVEGTAVTLDVAEWFAGGDATQVVLDVTDVGSPALDGVEFQVGGEYLVAVLDGSVRTCGLSGPADPALLAEYQEWFAG